MTTLPNLDLTLSTPLHADTEQRPRILLLYGSNRTRSFSRLLVEEAARVLQHLGAETRIFNPAGLPVRIEDPKCVAKTFPDYFEALFSVAKTPQTAIPVICVDGPTASGKGTLAVVLAQKLGYHFLDSGSLYRITALAALRAGLSLDSDAAQAIAALVSTLRIRFSQGRVWLTGPDGAEDDVSNTIRTEEAGMNASRVSALAPVREALIALQHSFRQLPGLVADGRDMGTVIFPQAPLKVFLTASAACRAHRCRLKLRTSRSAPARSPAAPCTRWPASPASARAGR